MRYTVSRRHFFGAIAAVSAFLPAVRRAHGLVAAPNPAAARLVGLFKHHDSARAIGSLYLATHPEEADAHKLLELVIRADDGPLVVHGTSDTELRAWVRRRQARDFATARIVNLDGWLLSATEVRICALAGLTWGHTDAREMGRRQVEHRSD
jgi:hypothetical protein